MIRSMKRAVFAACLACLCASSNAGVVYAFTNGSDRFRIEAPALGAFTASNLTGDQCSFLDLTCTAVEIGSISSSSTVVISFAEGRFISMTYGPLFEDGASYNQASIGVFVIGGGCASCVPAMIAARDRTLASSVLTVGMPVATVSAPTSLALSGLALLGVAATRSRRAGRL